MEPVFLTNFERISLEEMSSIRLMKRIDKKFIFSTIALPEIILALQQDYFVQAINQKEIFSYNTIYYDTPDYKMYNDHQNGKLNRLKVRTREYVDSNLFFLEVKKKSNKGVTQKERIPNQCPELILENKTAFFLSSRIPYDPTGLEAKLCSTYNRITLVNKAKTERVTIDLDLCFKNECNGKKTTLPNMVIIEIKKEQASYSPAIHCLNELRIKPKGLSKYCIGVALTEDSHSVKKNNFKSKLNDINKITSIIYE